MTISKFFLRKVANLALIIGFIFSMGLSRAQLYIASGPQDDTIGEYSTSGAQVNASLASGYTNVVGMAISDSDLFVLNAPTTNYSTGLANNDGSIAEYTLSGANVSYDLVSGLSSPSSFAASGSNLFILNSAAGTVAEYTTSGNLVNATLVSGLKMPVASQSQVLIYMSRKLAT